jgi:hypothetical protein
MSYSQIFDLAKKLGRDKCSSVFHVSVCYGDWTGTKSGYPDSRTASLDPNPVTLFKGAATEKKYKDQRLAWDP